MLNNHRFSLIGSSNSFSLSFKIEVGMPNNSPVGKKENLLSLVLLVPTFI